MATVDSYSESNYGGDTNVYSATEESAAGQSFTGDGSVLDQAKFYLAKLNSPTGNAYAKIYAHTGTFGSSGIPTGAALATSDAFNVATLSSSHALITFQFSGVNKITLTAATKYFVVIEYTNGDGSNTVLVGLDASSPTHAGNMAYNDARYGGWNAVSSQDICFYVLSGAGSPSVSPSSSVSPSVSPSASQSPSSSQSSSESASASSSPSPSPMPPANTAVLKIAKTGVNVLTNSDIEKLKLSSEYGTLKYFSRDTSNLTIDAASGDIACHGTITHNLGYYPFVEVFVSVYIGAATGIYEYCPFFGAGATVLYSANVKITTTTIELYGEIDGVSSDTWHFDFLVFTHKNNLQLS